MNLDCTGIFFTPSKLTGKKFPTFKEALTKRLESYGKEVGWKEGLKESFKILCVPSIFQYF